MNATKTTEATRSVASEPSEAPVRVQRLVRAPDWLLTREGITQRQWRVKKRRHLKELIKALNEYRMGCAYCPSKDGQVGKLDALLKTMWEEHKESNWPWRSNAKVSASGDENQKP